VDPYLHLLYVFMGICLVKYRIRLNGVVLSEAQDFTFFDFNSFSFLLLFLFHFFPSIFLSYLRSSFSSLCFQCISSLHKLNVALSHHSGVC